MDWSMNDNRVGPFFFKPLSACLAAMRGPVIENPEDSVGAAIRFLRHDLVDETLKRFNACFGFTSAKEFSLVNIPGSKIRQGSVSFVFMFSTPPFVRFWSYIWMDPFPSLDTGFFVSRKDIVPGAQRFSFPNAFVEIQNRGCLFFEFGIARKDPVAVFPGLEPVFLQPAADGTQTQGVIDPTSREGFALKIGQAEA